MVRGDSRPAGAERLVLIYFKTGCEGWATPSIYSIITPVIYAEVAQLVEQLTRNEQVAGSIPVFGSTLDFTKDRLV